MVAFLGCLLWAMSVQAEGPLADRAVVKSNPLHWQRRSAELELFKAIEAGQITVQAVPKDSQRVQVAITNTGHRPLSVRIPAAMALIADDTRTRGTSGASRPAFAVSGQVADAMVDFELPRPSVERLGRLLELEAGETVLEFLPAVRLDTSHWPGLGIRFRVAPAETIPSSRAISELLDQLAQSRCTPTVAQLAAWNLIGAQPWEELRRQTVVRGDGTIEPRFGPGEIQQARRLVTAASDSGDRAAAAVVDRHQRRGSGGPGNTERGTSYALRVTSSGLRGLVDK
jgi:hypothetical protein